MLGLKAGVGKFDRTCVREGLFGFAKSELRLCHFLICEPESGLQSAHVGARAAPKRSASATVSSKVFTSRQPDGPVSVDAGRKFRWDAGR